MNRRISRTQAGARSLRPWFAPWLKAIALVLCAALGCSAGPVLMISLDGMRPDYVTQADAHGLKIPNLRRFMKDGAYAEGVTGVVPTVTYPSHTTLVTGVWPAEHGILANNTFNPTISVESWYWYARDIKVRTLWDAAHEAHLVTASVSWPVTVGDGSIDYLIPEYWRTHTPEDHRLLEAISRPEGWLAKAEEKLGPYNESMGDNGPQGDVLRNRFALELIATQKPSFMTVHLAGLDHVEHQTGPFSKESDSELEDLDVMVGQLAKAALANDPSTTIVVVSDHGFLSIDHEVNLVQAFIKAGLVQINPATATRPATIKSWDAAVWSAGGSAAIVLRPGADENLRKRVSDLLAQMKSDPAYSIARVIAQPELAKLGGFPEAAFLVEMAPRAEAGGLLTGSLVNALPGQGTHGFLPDRPELRASFFAMGSGIVAGRNLGVIDMRQIAPTIASLLKVSLPGAKAAKLDVAK
jgi:predicted AlkP superfamily pyrophosphatase or phosphodiesterase